MTDLLIGTFPDIRVTAVTSSIIRVCVRSSQVGTPRASHVVNLGAEVGRSLSLLDACTSGAIHVAYDPEADALTFRRSDGEVLVREAPGSRQLQPILVDNEPAVRVTQGWMLAEDESIYGLGQHQEGCLDWRGRSCLLAPGNRQAALPMLVSHRGWGILWDAAGMTRFTDGPDGMSLCTEAAEQLDYYLIDGGDLDGVIAGYRLLTGSAAAMPRWALGYWQSRERYVSQQQFLDIAAEHDRRGIALDCLVQDWAYWGRLGWNAMRFDPSEWPDPAEAMRTLHERHRLHAMISVWPSVGVDTEVHRELADAGLLFTAIAHWGNGHVYDAFSEEGRAIYGRHLRCGILDKGFDAVWLDGTEPEFSGAQGQEETSADVLASGVTAAGSWSLVLNAFSLATTAGVRETMLAAHPEQRPVILARSAWAGQQRHGVVTWSGDIAATWEVLRRQIPAGLNFSLAGIPWWTTDIGGFFTNAHGALFPAGCKDPAYRELYLRWFQFGAFCPVFRSHGTNTPREVWQFGEPGEPIYDALMRMLRLRYRMMPYLYTLAWEVAEGHSTPMRALAMDHPQDATARRVSDQFGCGRALMVCPVTEPMYAASSADHAVVPELDLRVNVDGGAGVQAHYFNSPDWSAQVTCRTENVIDADWSGSPPFRISAALWSVRWDGALSIAGRHVLVVTAGAGIRLQLNGRTVIDAVDNAAEKRWEIPFEGTEGRPLPFSLAFRSRPGGRPGVRLGIRRSDGGDGLRLVPPVRRVVLPSGVGWTDFWTGAHHAGGQMLNVPAPLETLPLFMPDGAMLLLGPDCRRADDTVNGPLELRICAGRDGACTWYEDAGDGFGYAGGERSVVAITWDDDGRRLHLGDRQGGYPGMPARRELRIVLVRPGHGIGEGCAIPDAVVVYEGCAMTTAIS